MLSFLFESVSPELQFLRPQINLFVLCSLNAGCYTTLLIKICLCHFTLVKLRSKWQQEVNRQPGLWLLVLVPKGLWPQDVFLNLQKETPAPTSQELLKNEIRHGVNLGPVWNIGSAEQTIPRKWIEINLWKAQENCTRGQKTEMGNGKKNNCKVEDRSPTEINFILTPLLWYMDNVPLKNLTKPLSPSRWLLSVAKGYRLSMCVN